MSGATKFEFGLLEERQKQIEEVEKFVDSIRAKQAAGTITAAQAQGAINSAIKQEENNLKGLNIQTIDNIGFKDALINRLKVLKITSEGNSRQIEIESRALQERGTTATQVAKKIQNAQRVINNPTDQSALDQAFQEQVDGVNQLLELGDRTIAASLEDFEELNAIGMMTREEAITTFEAIASNTNASAEIQIKAIESIKKIRQDQIKTLQRDFEEENITAKELITQLEEFASLPGKANREARETARAAINKTADAELSRAVQNSTDAAAEVAAANSAIVTEFFKDNRDKEVEANQVRIEARRDDLKIAKETEKLKLQSLTARLDAEKERIRQGLPKLLNRSDREKIERDIRLAKLETAKIADQLIQTKSTKKMRCSLLSSGTSSLG